MEDTCFIIMPIGTQAFGDVEYSESDLRAKYDDLIRKALETAREGLKVYRADDVSMPGSITNDILSKLMFSKYVVADISLPNPNVFYELGLRHAIRTGTILIKDKEIENRVFDISYMRHIEYENTATGLRNLSEELRKTFTWIDKNPQKADNQFIELAGFLKFQYPRFIDPEEELRKKRASLLAFVQPFLKRPEMMKVFMDPDVDQDEKNMRMLEMFKEDPDLLTDLFKGFVSSGLVDS